MHTQIFTQTGTHAMRAVDMILIHTAVCHFPSSPDSLLFSFCAA